MRMIPLPKYLVTQNILSFISKDKQSSKSNLSKSDIKDIPKPISRMTNEEMLSRRLSDDKLRTNTTNNSSSILDLLQRKSMYNIWKIIFIAKRSKVNRKGREMVSRNQSSKYAKVTERIGLHSS